jgi:hypothetical protein
MSGGFTEHTALNLAAEDIESDSGNHEPLDAYLRENFLPSELRQLSNACALLGARAYLLARDARLRP